MLNCQYTILKCGKDGKLYLPKHQHRIFRFFWDDLFGWITWPLTFLIKEAARDKQKPNSPEQVSKSK